MSGITWRRNGDHPDDRVGELADWMGSGEPYAKLEGAVVRFYRHPWSPGDRYHTGSDITEERGCGHRWHDHGWIDQGEDGITVCPGDMVYTRPDGAYGVRKGHEMSEKTMGQIAFEAYRDAVKGAAYDGSPIPEWNSLDGDRLKAQGGWEAAAEAVSGTVIDGLVKLGAEVAANPPTIRPVSTRWQPLSRPVTPGEVQSLPEGAKMAPPSPGAYEGQHTVPVEVGPDSGDRPTVSATVLHCQCGCGHTND